jgi:hypothetical protein
MLPTQSEPNPHRAFGIWPGLCLAASIAALEVPISGLMADRDWGCFK